MAENVASRCPRGTRGRRVPGGGGAGWAVVLILIGVLGTGWVGAWPGRAEAQTAEPQVITYQGRLKGPGGNAISGVHQLTLRIYDVRTGSDPALWVETHPSVQVTNGEFMVEMGAITSLDTLDFGAKLFLEIQVDADPPMAPRLALTSIGHAFQALRARSAERATGADRADRATGADTADVATTCCTTEATAAGYAVNATNAATAGHATTAGSATSAGTADHATTAGSATTADFATSAGTAGHATTADSATLATSATTAERAQTADRALTRTEGRHATVVTALDSGAPGPGSRYYTSPLDAMADLAAWCPAPSAANPCVLTLMPGVYTLVGADLQMVSGVTVQGSGEAATRIVGTVRGATDAEVRGLTIEEYRFDTPAFLNPSGADRVRLRQVRLLAPGTAVSNRGVLSIADARIGGCTDTTRDCVAVPVVGASLTLDRVAVTPTSTRTAIASFGFSLVLTDVTIGGTAGLGLGVLGGGFGTATNLTIAGLGGISDGIDVSAVGTLDLQGSAVSVSGVALRLGSNAAAFVGHSTIEGAQRAIRLEGSAARAGVGSSRISGGAEFAPFTFASSVLRCFFAYDGNFTPLDASCQPPP